MRRALAGLTSVILLLTLPALAGSDVRHLAKKDILSGEASLPAEGIVTTGQPDAELLDVIAEAGFAAVVDFRGPDEDRGLDEKTAVEERGMRYIAIPVAGTDDISYENARLLDDALGGIDGPVLMHCASGNRAAAILALRAKQNGADAEAALQTGLDAGLTRSRKVVEERLGL